MLPCRTLINTYKLDLCLRSVPEAADTTCPGSCLRRPTDATVRWYHDGSDGLKCHPCAKLDAAAARAAQVQGQVCKHCGEELGSLATHTIKPGRPFLLAGKCCDACKHHPFRGSNGELIFGRGDASYTQSIPGFSTMSMQQKCDFRDQCILNRKADGKHCATPRVGPQ
jgi:hypothetical protein